MLKKDVLTTKNKDFIYDHWQESASHLNGLAGAFFTPQPIADLMTLEIGGARREGKTRVIDLCGGIGALSYPLTYKFLESFDLTIIELNPDYVEVGKRLIPQARWICADVLDLPSDLGHFDVAIANPPFGVIKSNGKSARYTGPNFEYKVLDVASDLANFGVFVLPQTSCPFKYSGVRCFEYVATNEKYLKFREQTGIKITPNSGLDTETCGAVWHGVKVTVEIACVKLDNARKRRLGLPVNEDDDCDGCDSFDGSSPEEELSVALAALPESEATEDASLPDVGLTSEPMESPVQFSLF